MNAIVGIKELAMTFAWDYDNFGRADTIAKGTNVGLSFRTFAQPRGKRSTFQIGHVILSIYKAVNLMVVQSAFCNAEVTVSLHGQRLGIVTISKRLFAPSMVTGNSTDFMLRIPDKENQDDVTLPTRPNGVPATMSRRTNPYNFPEIVDPEDPLFKITYNFNGPPIPRDHVLSAMLDAMVTIAKVGPETRCHSLDARGFSGSNTMMHVSPYEPRSPSYGSAARALTLVWDNVMRKQNNWAEVSFDIWHGDSPIATGFVMATKAGMDFLTSRSS